MNWFWMNVPLMALFFAAWTGIPLWLSLRHADTGPASPVEDVELVLAQLSEAELVDAG